MKSVEFEQYIKLVMDHCKETLAVKASKYATEDRLHNFKVAAGPMGATPLQALAGMMVKHTVRIYDMINSDETYPCAEWMETLGDHINYLAMILPLAVESDRVKTPKKEKGS